MGIEWLKKGLGGTLRRVGQATLAHSPTFERLAEGVIGLGEGSPPGGVTPLLGRVEGGSTGWVERESLEGGESGRKVVVY